MNLSTKCNCCVSENVCKYKAIYEQGVKAILKTIIPSDGDGFWALKDCPHIEVSIKCPHMITKSQTRKDPLPDYLQGNNNGTKEGV